MVIRPYTELHQPGIEFGLTYFDDPGVNVPSTITSWVTMTGISYIFLKKLHKYFFYNMYNFIFIYFMYYYILGLPDFLLRMRHASKNYQNYKLTKDANISTANRIFANDDIISEHSVDDESDKESEILDARDTQETDLIEEIETLTFTELEQSDTCDVSDMSDEDIDIEDSTDEGRGLLRYFFLTKLFV